MFVLTRKELRLPDGGMEVDESRDYFGNDGDLIRELTKSARFKAGESTDTKRVPNVAVDLPKPHDPLLKKNVKKPTKLFPSRNRSPMR